MASVPSRRGSPFILRVFLDFIITGLGNTQSRERVRFFRLQIAEVGAQACQNFIYGRGRELAFHF
jgi:hypothetical protein